MTKTEALELLEALDQTPLEARTREALEMAVKTLRDSRTWWDDLLDYLKN